MNMPKITLLVGALLSLSLLAGPALFAQKKGLDLPTEFERILTTQAALAKTYRAAGLDLIKRARDLRFSADGYDAGGDATLPIEIEGDFVLNPPESMLLDLGASYLANRDKKNWIALFAIIYDVLPPEILAELPPKNKIRKLKPKELQELWIACENEVFTAVPFATTGAIPPPPDFNPIGECDLEVGTEYAGIDGEVSTRCDTDQYASLGIMGNIAFPLRDDLTCVKDQTRRGTCVAQTMCAVVETLRIVEDGTINNLSEQDAFFAMKTESSHSVAALFSDALFPSLALPCLEATNYEFQYEKEWNYARGTERRDPSAELHPTQLVPYFPDACNGDYRGEQCTEWASNGTHTFTQPGVPAAASRPSVPSKGVEEISSITALPIDPVVTWSSSLAALKLLLDAEIPAFVSFRVTDDMKSSSPGKGVDTSGYVLYTGATERDGETPGGHAMACIGWVRNNDLPTGAPRASGDGYFVFKNSWGIESGDCGFYYLDEGYVRYNGTYIAVVSIE